MAAHKAAKVWPKFSEMQLKGELLKQGNQELRDQFHSQVAKPLFMKFVARYGKTGIITTTATGDRRRRRSPFTPHRSEQEELDRKLFEVAAAAMYSYRGLRVQEEQIKHLCAHAEWMNANHTQRIALLPKRSLWLLRAFLVTEPMLYVSHWFIRAFLWAARRIP